LRIKLSMAIGGIALLLANAGPVTGQTAGPKPGGGLKSGEYACFGSGGRILIGLGFKVQAGGRYTDLDGKNPGTYSVSGDQVTFRGGHLDGQTGRDLKDNKFRVGTMASCEPS
jgi:hypothetical protein